MVDIAFAVVLLLGSALALLVGVRLQRPIPEGPSRRAPSPDELIDQMERVVLQQQDARLATLREEVRVIESNALERQRLDARATKTRLLQELDALIERDVAKRGFFDRIGFDLDDYVKCTLRPAIVEEYEEFKRRHLGELREELQEFISEHTAEGAGASGDESSSSVLVDVLAGAGVYFAAAALGGAIGVAIVTGLGLLSGFSSPKEMAKEARTQVRTIVQGLFAQSDGYRVPETGELLPSVLVETATATREICERVEKRLETSADRFRVRARAYFSKLRLEAHHSEVRVPSPSEVVNGLVSP